MFGMASLVAAPPVQYDGQMLAGVRATLVSQPSRAGRESRAQVGSRPFRRHDAVR
jgi:hypothetical protein